MERAKPREPFACVAGITKGDTRVQSGKERTKANERRKGKAMGKSNQAKVANTYAQN